MVKVGVVVIAMNEPNVIEQNMTETYFGIQSTEVKLRAVRLIVDAN
jgi:hypothetical protein